MMCPWHGLINLSYGLLPRNTNYNNRNPALTAHWSEVKSRFHINYWVFPLGHIMSYLQHHHVFDTIPIGIDLSCESECIHTRLIPSQRQAWAEGSFSEAVSSLWTILWGLLQHNPLFDNIPRDWLLACETECTHTRLIPSQRPAWAEGSFIEGRIISQMFDAMLSSMYISYYTAYFYYNGMSTKFKTIIRHERCIFFPTNHWIVQDTDTKCKCTLLNHVLKQNVCWDQMCSKLTKSYRIDIMSMHK